MKRAAMALFRRLPRRLRLATVHLLMPNFTVGAVVVLRRGDGKFALVEQRHSPGWALPGGLLRRKEPPADGVVREVAEELGISLDPTALPVPFASVNSSARRVDVVYFVDLDGPHRLRADDDEVSRTGWFALDALPEISEPTQEILRAVRLL